MPLYNLMEDAATAEISRTQLWQWLHQGASMDNGETLNVETYKRMMAEELQAIRQEIGDERFEGGKFEVASQLFDDMILNEAFVEFLTLPAQAYLD